jgi:alpha-galactosidase/6-phospho-beta-glucosidase family protein
MKIVVIGGSSPSTPSLIRELSLRRDLPPLEVILLGQSEARTQAVLRAARLLATGTPIQISSVLTSDHRWTGALVGSEVIILQARPGGYESRRHDEQFPSKYGVCGDQDLGPGGLSNGWRSWPALRRYFLEAQRCAPEAIFLVLSSPVGLLVRLGQRAAPALRILGICEVPWVTLVELCCDLGARVEEVHFGYVGIHHLGWFYRLDSGARNLLDEYAEFVRLRDRFPSQNVIRSYEAIPTRYVRLHCSSNSADLVRELKLSSQRRCDHLIRFRENALRVFASGNKEEIVTILGERLTPWYSRAIVPFVASAVGAEIEEALFLSDRHPCRFPEFEDRDVFEAACDLKNGVIVPRSLVEPLPPEVSMTIRQYIAAERLAAKAIWMNSQAMLVGALNHHPWTAELGQKNLDLAHEIAGGGSGSIHRGELA